MDIGAFVDGLIFDVIIGNADAHGKNYFLPYHGGQRSLAPFYDLVCTLAWPGTTTMPATRIGRSESLDSITAEHWQRMAKETGTS